MKAYVEREVTPCFVVDLFAGLEESCAVGGAGAEAVKDGKGAEHLSVDDLSEFQWKRQKCSRHL